VARVILDWDQKYKRAIIVSEFLENIRARFSVPNDTKQILKRQGRPTWHIADFISPITNTGRFELGLYFEIINSLKADPNIEYDIITTTPLEEQLIQTYPWKGSYNIAKLSMDLRPYQESGVKRGVHMGYGLMIVGTAGGKTLLMASLIETIRQNSLNKFTTLIILPSNLVSQTYKEFLSYGIKSDDISMWGGDESFSKAPIIVASVEILRANLTTFSEQKPKAEFKWKPDINSSTYQQYLDNFAQKEKIRKKEWVAKRKHILEQLDDVDLLLIDEVHGLRKGNVINDVITRFKTRHRFGFTGTLPPDLTDQWNIMGMIGPILCNIDSAALREMGYVSQVKIQILRLFYKNKIEAEIDFHDPTKAYTEEGEFLYHNEFRNKVIAKLACNFDKNALIMVDKIDHGETLEKLLSANTGKNVYFIRGSVETEDREKLRALMETSNNIICIAMSRIFAVGINIKNLHYVIFAQGGKAKVTLIQSIGRGLRLHDQKECLVIIDIADTTHYGALHLDERMVYYKEEQIEYEIKDLFE
jgi:superfamily II DNA or RNA helicase